MCLTMRKILAIVSLMAAIPIETRPIADSAVEGAVQEDCSALLLVVARPIVDWYNSTIEYAAGDSRICRTSAAIVEPADRLFIVDAAINLSRSLPFGASILAVVKPYPDDSPRLPELLEVLITRQQKISFVLDTTADWVLESIREVANATGGTVTQVAFSNLSLALDAVLRQGTETPDGTETTTPDETPTTEGAPELTPTGSPAPEFPATERTMPTTATPEGTPAPDRAPTGSPAPESSYRPTLIIAGVVIGVLFLATAIIYCCCKRAPRYATNCISQTIKQLMREEDRPGVDYPHNQERIELQERLIERRIELQSSPRDDRRDEGSLSPHPEAVPHDAVHGPDQLAPAAAHHPRPTGCQPADTQCLAAEDGELHLPTEGCVAAGPAPGHRATPETAVL